MKLSTLALLVTTFASMNLFAVDNQQALQICGLAGFSDSRNLCIQTVSQANYFDKGALDACFGVAPSSKTSCIQAIANKQYDAGVASSCSMGFSESIVSCLRNAGKPFVAQPMLNPVPTPSRPTPPAVGNTSVSTARIQAYCKSIGGLYTTACLQVAATAHFVDDSAFKACVVIQGRYASTPAQVKCLEVVVNNDFDAQVTECQNAGGETSTLMCLQKHLK